LPESVWPVGGVATKLPEDKRRNTEGCTKLLPHWRYDSLRPLLRQNDLTTPTQICSNAPDDIVHHWQNLVDRQELT